MSALGTDLVPYREQMNGLWNAGNNTRQLIVQHTTESEGGNTSVIGFLERTKNGSYQTMTDFDGEEVRMVPDDKQAWGAMNQGNRRGLHTCAMGRAEWERARWLREGKLLERTAMRYAEWSRLYGIPLVKITAAQARTGERGIVGHIDISAAFHESDHWDPGHDFPYDIVIARAKEINGAPTPKEGNDMAFLDEKITNWKGEQVSVGTLLHYLDKHVGLSLDQLGGDGTRLGKNFPGWEFLGNRTTAEALGVIGAALNIPGFRDPNATEETKK